MLRQIKNLIVVIEFFAIIASFCGTAAAEIYCDHCLQPINGIYFKNGNNTYCEKCYREMQPRCARCGTEIEGIYYKIYGEIYCPKCAKIKTAIYCDECRQEIHGKYYNLHGERLCSICYAKYGPKCDICGMVLYGKFYTKDRHKYCYKCYQEKIVKRCAICDKKIFRSGYKELAGERYFCKLCVEKYPQCESCGAPADSYRSKQFPLCSRCQKEIISTEEQLRALFEEVQRTAQNSLGLKVNLNPQRVHFATDQQLKGGDDPEHTKKLGLCMPKFLGFFLLRQDIYIKSRMPRTMTIDSLAHEYGHAWLNVNCKRKLTPIEEEGFAEWVSYKVLYKSGMGQRAIIKKKNTVPIYGDGLRKMLQLESKHGTKWVIDSMKHS